MLIDNHIALKRRTQEILIDYACILIYLLILFGANMGFFLGFWGGIPEFNESESQMIALFASVIPVVLIFSVWDYKKGSLGKRKARLVLYFKHRSFMASLIRNIVKFLPWQLAHIGVVHGMYSDFDIIAVAFACTGMVLALVLFIMGLTRKDKRHLGDLIAGTQVQAMQDKV